MRSFPACFRRSGSLTAGFLIGLAMVASVFAMTIADTGESQSAWMLGATVTLALGLALQVVVTLKPRRPRTTAARHGAAPVRFPELGHQH